MQVKNFITRAMETLKVEFTAREQTLVEAKIQRRIFRRDSMWLLLFVIVLMSLNNIFKDYKGDKVARKDKPLYVY